jgi:integrase
MAYYRKTDKGWRVEVERRGVRKSRTFATKAAATAWASKEETAILDGDASKWPRKTVRDAIDRYSAEVTEKKASKRNELLRFNAFCREFPDLAGKIISEVAEPDIAAWRNARLAKVLPASVKREANSLRAVWGVAIKEWHWCPKSPWTAVKLPADSPSRERVAGWREIRRILRRCDYVTHRPPVSGLQNAAWAFLVGLRTGMRASEILSLTTASLIGPVATVKHKMQHLTGRPRKVPLTPQGARLLGELCEFARSRGDARLLKISSSSLDAQFRKVTGSLLIEDLHFHDSRATALTRLSRKVDVMTLAKISGHRDIRILQNTYYREQAEEIAARLALPSVPRQ